MKYFNLIFAIVFFTNVSAFSQNEALQKGLDAISEDVIKAQMEFLASDWTEGRETGTKGAYLASDYIASLFKIYGIQPAGDNAYSEVSRVQRWEGVQSEKYQSYFQNFNVIKYNYGNEHELSLISTSKNDKRILHFKYKTDFSFYASNIGVENKAPVIFAGYGLIDEKNNYNDFKNIDVRGKIILKIDGFPGHNDTASVAYKKFHRKKWQERYKIRRKTNEYLKEQGVVAIIEIDMKGYDADYWSTNTPFRYNGFMYEGDVKQDYYYDYAIDLFKDTLDLKIPYFYISKRVANEIVKETNISFDDFEKQVAISQESSTKLIKDKIVKFKTTVDSELLSARNVIGVIEGKQTDSIIVIGGHYDHLGKHSGYIWNGADDNASGTVGVMTLAKACLSTGIKPQKTLVFAAWSGEERGLLGSKYFIHHPYKSPKNIITYLNFDMIGRDSKSDTLGVEVDLNYSHDYPVFKEMSSVFNEKYKLGLDIINDELKPPYGSSDHAPFAKKNIPVFYYMAGWHIDYHQPSDHNSKINYEKMAKIIKLAFLNIWEIANSDCSLKQGKKKE